MRRSPHLALILGLSWACGDKDEGPTDADGDGYAAGEDCDDADPQTWPGAEERCDGADNDCDGEADEDPTDGETFYLDADGDGQGDPGQPVRACDLPDGAATTDDDCDDTEPAAYVGAAEICDGIDNDCDGDTDDADSTLDPDSRTVFYRDADGDGHGVDGDTLEACQAPVGYAAEAGDCDDLRDDVSPGAAEVCDDRDNDCDGLADDDDDDVDLSTGGTWYADGDGDGYGDPDAPVSACQRPDGAVSDDQDCDDDDSDVRPGAFDVCGDSADGNCDGRVDETCPVSATTADATATGEGLEDLAGARLSAGGDFDGDGLADLAVGARRHDAGASNAGRAYLWLGPTTGTTALSSAALILDGLAADDEAGAFVHLGGDLDGDGFAELTVAARADDTGALDGGAAYVVFGPLTGSHDVDVDGLVVAASSERAWVGERGAGVAGDLNNDGRDDLLVTAWGLDAPGGVLDEGQVAVFFGPLSGALTLADADVTVTGSAALQQAGGAWSDVGDVSGDGVDDLAVASPGGDAVWVFYGAVLAGDRVVTDADIRLIGAPSESFGSSLATGDFDGDGRRDLVVGAPFADPGGLSSGALFGFSGPVNSTTAASAADWTVGGAAALAQVGSATAQLASGDLDGDGDDELFAGLPFDDGAGTDAGAVAAWFGPLAGTVSATDAWRTVQGAAAGDKLGHGLAVGDIDGDGIVDLAAGAPESDAAAAEAGGVSLFFGAGLR